MRVLSKQCRRGGFTIMEMMVASVLMVLVGTLLANTWVCFGRPAISAVARARLAQEANLAAEAIAHDVGLLARPAQWQADSRYQNVQPSGSSLYLTIDDGTGSVRTVTYTTDPNDPSNLIRIDSGTNRVVARLVSSFQCTIATLPLGPSGVSVSGVQIELTLTHRVYDRDPDGTFRGDHTRLYTLFVPDPQS